MANDRDVTFDIMKGNGIQLVIVCLFEGLVLSIFG